MAPLALHTGFEVAAYFVGMRLFLWQRKRLALRVLADRDRSLWIGVATICGAAIVAIAFGVPVFRSPRNDLSKYAMLKKFDGVHSLQDNNDASSDWLCSRLGRKSPSRAAIDASRAVSAHWDKVAVLVGGARKPGVPIAIRNLWQRLPGDLESRAELAARFAQSGKLLGDLREENAALRNSLSWKITSPLRLLAGLVQRRSTPAAVATTTVRQPVESANVEAVIHFEAIARQTLAVEPYAWAEVDGLFSSDEAADLALTFPRDRFKLVQGYDGEKDYGYHVRELIGMGSQTISHAAALSPVWRHLATDLLSSRYRAAVGRLTGIDLSKRRMEVNAFHYAPGAWLGPHVDLADKIVTHVLYFNPTWNIANGGCLNILRSADMNDSERVVPPIVGTSAILVRSDKSWHAVSRVDRDCAESRRSITVTFYGDTAVSTMWPSGDNTPTFDYGDANDSA